MASFVSGGGGGSDIFVVEYETTTYAELSSAITSKKTIVMDGSSNGTSGFIPITQIKEDTTSNVISFDLCSWVETNVGGNNLSTVMLIHFTVSDDETWDSTYRTLSNYIVAEYGTTTYNEIILGTANEDTQLTIVQYQGHYYIPSYRESGVSSVKLRCLNSTESFIDFTVNANDEWSATVTDIAQISKIWTGTCSTAGETNTKVATLDDATGFTLAAGTKIAITFTNGINITNANNVTLNVNSTGAKTVVYPTSTSGVSTNFNNDNVRCFSNETILFSYTSGNQWIFEGSAFGQYKTYNLASSALPKSGGTMTGALTLSGAPTSNLHAATKKYVDDSIGNIDALPDQTGQSGKFLTTNGTAASWTTANYQPKYTISATTILASGWSNGSYSALQTTYPAASYDLSLELNGDSITSAQQDAWNAAQIVGSATTNVLKALGEVPTIDIPVIVKATPNTDTYLSDVESLLASI